jgi:hypothetical protein
MRFQMPGDGKTSGDESFSATDSCQVTIKDPSSGLADGCVQISRKRLASIAPESMLVRLLDPKQQLKVQKKNDVYVLSGAFTPLVTMLKYLADDNEPTINLIYFKNSNCNL